MSTTSPPTTAALAHLSPSERKRRKPISCDTCRTRKRKCNRRHPCEQCELFRHECRYTQANAFKTASQQDIDKAQDSHENDGDVVDDTATVLALLTSPTFIDSFLPLWLSQLDFLYDSIVDSQLHVDFRAARLDPRRQSHYQPLLAIMVAVAAQVMPDAIARIHSMTPHLQRACFRFATSRVDSYLDDYQLQRCGPIRLEYLQASLQCITYMKNDGRALQMRHRLARDISCLQLARLHLLDHPSPSRGGYIYRGARLRHSARRLFWSYYQCDRFYLMMGDVGTMLFNPAHCDVWLCDMEQNVVHVSALYPAAVPANDSHTRPAYRSPLVVLLGEQDGENDDEDNDVRTTGLGCIAPLSRFSSALSRAAAISGQITDTITAATLSAWSGSNDTLVDLTLQTLNYRIQTAQLDASLETLLADCQRIADDRQSYVLSVTLSKLRFDSAIALADALPPFLLDAGWLRRHRINLASRVVEKALRLPDYIPLASLGWSFFLFGITKPLQELQALAPFSSDDVCSAAAEQLIEQGRALLCDIASASKVPLAHQLAKEVCSMRAPLGSVQERQSGEGVANNWQQNVATLSLDSSAAAAGISSTTANVDDFADLINLHRDMLASLMHTQM